MISWLRRVHMNAKDTKVLRHQYFPCDNVSSQSQINLFSSFTTLYTNLQTDVHKYIQDMKVWCIFHIVFVANMYAIYRENDYHLERWMNIVRPINKINKKIPKERNKASKPLTRFFLLYFFNWQTPWLWTNEKWFLWQKITFI